MLVSLLQHRVQCTRALGKELERVTYHIFTLIVHDDSLHDD